MYKALIVIAISVLSGCTAEVLEFTSRGGNECEWIDEDGGVHPAPNAPSWCDSEDAGED